MRILSVPETDRLLWPELDWDVGNELQPLPNMRVAEANRRGNPEYKPRRVCHCSECGKPGHRRPTCRERR